MYVLLFDTSASINDAAYAICEVPHLTYKWVSDLSTKIPAPMFTAEASSGCADFVTLRAFIDFYAKRDSASFKIIARGSSIPRLIERYPELFI